MQRSACLRVMGALLFVGFTSAAVFAGPVSEAYPNAAFNIKINNVLQGSATGKYGPTKDFNVNGVTFTISTIPVRPLDATNPNISTTVDFKNVLAGAFPAWTIKYYKPDGTTDLSLANNDFVVKSYDVKNVPNDVQCDFYSSYVGAAPARDADLHWIQVIKTNWKANNPIYTNDNKVDNGGAVVDPYYDTSGVATGSLGDPDMALFWDSPTRGNPGLLSAYNGTTIYWYAEVYLAKQTAAQTVEIYDGIRWGWQIVPEPASLSFVFVVIGVLRRRVRRAAA